MPGPIKYYKKDPNGKGRGPGEYYHRGGGKYAKYSEERDLARKSSRGAKPPAGHTKRKSHRTVNKDDPYRHTTDYVPKKQKKEVVVKFPGGSRYVLSVEAQKRREKAARKKR